MIISRKGIALLSLVLLLFFNSVSLFPQLPAAAAELGPLLVAMQSLKSMVHDSIAQANEAARDRIHQIEVALDDVIKKIEGVIEKGYAALNLTREQLFRNIFEVLSRTNTIIQDLSYILFIRINQTLASLAGIVDSLPFINVEPSIFAVDPYRMKTDRTDRMIYFYGYFGKILWTDSKAPLVMVNENKTIRLEKYDGGRLGFKLPDDMPLKEQTFLSLRAKIHKKGFLFFNKSYVFNSRIYVEKATPFSFAIVQNVDNPNKWANLSGTINIVANSGSGEGIKSFSATDVFSRTINDNVTYDMNSATLTGVSLSVTGQGKSADCAPNPSARIERWNPGSLEASMSAPFHNGHMRTDKIPPYWCGGGGSHIEANINATMKLKKRNTPEEIVGKSDTDIKAARNAVRTVDALSNWSSITVTGKFEDRDEKYESYVNVSPGVPAGSTALWSIRVENGKVVIITNRE